MKLKIFAFIFAIVFVFTISGAAQTPQPTPPPIVEDDGEIIKIDSRLVVVPVSVLDTNGQPVIGLKEQDFRIAEGRLAIPIVSPREFLSLLGRS